MDDAYLSDVISVVETKSYTIVLQRTEQVQGLEYAVLDASKNRVMGIGSKVLGCEDDNWIVIQWKGDDSELVYEVSKDGTKRECTVITAQNEQENGGGYFFCCDYVRSLTGKRYIFAQCVKTHNSVSVSEAKERNHVFDLVICFDSDWTMLDTNALTENYRIITVIDENWVHIECTDVGAVVYTSRDAVVHLFEP